MNPRERYIRHTTDQLYNYGPCSTCLMAEKRFYNRRFNGRTFYRVKCGWTKKILNKRCMLNKWLYGCEVRSMVPKHIMKWNQKIL